MTQYEYKCVAGPAIIGVKNQSGINNVMEQFASLFNAGAQKGWEFHCLETIAIETAQGCFRPSLTQNYHMLIFKRPIQN